MAAAFIVMIDYSLLDIENQLYSPPPPEKKIRTLSSIKHQPCQSNSARSLHSSSLCAVAMVTSSLGLVLFGKHAVFDGGCCCERDECVNEPDYEQLCTQWNAHDKIREEWVWGEWHPASIIVKITWCEYQSLIRMHPCASLQAVAGWCKESPKC